MRVHPAIVIGALLALLVADAGGAIDRQTFALIKTKLARGELLLGKSEYSKAESVFRSAIGLEPSIPTAHLGLAAALVGQERFDDALAVLAEAEQRFVDWEQTISMAEVRKRQLSERQLQSLKDLAAAQSVQSSPASIVGTPRDLDQISEQQISKEQFLFRERRRLEVPRAIPAQVFYLEGISFLRTKRPILGIEALEVCLLVDRNHALAHYNLAVALLGQGEIEGAREHLDAAVVGGIAPHPQFVAALERAEG